MARSLLIFAIILVVLLNILPAFIVAGLLDAPVGSRVRPMGLPIAILVCGCGALVLVVPLAVGAFVRSLDSLEEIQHKVLFRSVAVLCCVLAITPLLMTTLGVKWIIAARNLNLAP